MGQERTGLTGAGEREPSSPPRQLLLFFLKQQPPCHSIGSNFSGKDSPLISLNEDGDWEESNSQESIPLPPGDSFFPATGSCTGRRGLHRMPW